MRELSEIVDVYKMCKEIIENDRVNTRDVSKIINIIQNISNINLDSKTKRILKDTCLKALIVLYTNGIIDHKDLQKINLSNNDIEILKEFIKLEKNLLKNDIEPINVLQTIVNFYSKLDNLNNNIIPKEKLESVIKDVFKKIIDKLPINEVMKIIQYTKTLLEESVRHSIIRERLILTDFVNMLRLFCKEFREETYDNNIILHVIFLKSKYRVIIGLSEDFIKTILRNFNTKSEDYEDIIITTSGKYFQDNTRCLVILDIGNGKVLSNCSRDIILLLESLVKRIHVEDFYSNLRKIVLSIIKRKSLSPISKRIICYLSSREVLDILYNQYNISASLYDVLVIFYDLYKSGIGDIRPIEDDFYLIVRNLPNYVEE